MINPNKSGFYKNGKWFCSKKCYKEWLIKKIIEMHNSHEYLSKSRIRLGMILMEKGLISPEQLKIVLDTQKKTDKKLGEILLEKGYINEIELLSSLSRQFGLSFVDISTLKEFIVPDGTIPEEILIEFRTFPLLINHEDRFINLAITDPSDRNLLLNFFSEALPDYKINFHLASEKLIENILREFYPDKIIKFNLPEDYKKAEIEEKIMNLVNYLSKEKDVKNFNIDYLENALWLKFDWGKIGCDFYFTKKNISDN
jgi:hypothetical protein